MSAVHKVTPDRCGPAPGSTNSHFLTVSFIGLRTSGKLRCGPGNCEATLDWWVGSKTCDGDIFDSMTFTFPAGATDGTMSACVVTNGAGSDEECSVGGQACSRAIQYHEFLPDQTPWHIHEYCACN